MNGWMNTMAMFSQILRWMKKPKVLRLLCLASTVVGLICYGLSSFLNHLLGNWSCWKMFLYIVFSFIVCLAVLFAPARSSSTSLRLEAHLAFLVLMLTSVYSFFIDNVVKGKPDAYSLISCAAFATMSLSLSNLSQFGFQIDLLYFFCGALTIQLMKIRLWLVIVGAGFTYSLLQLRDYPSDTPEENLQPDEENQLLIIEVDDTESDAQQANFDVDSTLGSSPEDEDLRFRDHLLTQSDSHPEDAGLIIQQEFMNCIKELEKENQRLVPIVGSHVENYIKAVFDSKEVSDPNVNLVMDVLPLGIMRRLKENGKLMVDAGFMDECIDIYSKSRKAFVEQCLRPLGLQFQTPNKDVEKWSKTWKAVGKILFPNEMRLCSYIFSGIHDAAGVSAVEKVCKKISTDLLSFTDTTITADNYLPNLLSYIVPKVSESLGELTPELISPTSVHESSIVDDIKDVRQSLGMLNQSRDSIHPNNNDIKDVRQILAMLNKIGGNILYPNKEKTGLIDGGFHLVTDLLKKKIRKL
ncbi:hypothetical protein LR48_Vigan07g102800 [Vigna angularis]|uniref:Exocyst subunit Exo70 family protein n=2 Tax=Phaseolus angularis TaxID=3914 RepID=A0A0L9UXP5_PHAAN|nr:uncharacterized protein LOC108337679 [Vigna angularis]KAG2391524.1 uncharacterized protein HKW66_Vig0127150 [Vigna angularis]KOM47324.1 hypothetical protein LR48_Vigan07g102800 [Vigna angularis]BAT81472.1 hypothetical protein VIGAN_03119700 [Vigna angularis var. angularis]